MEQFEPDLKVSYRGHLQIITFNRPRKANAFGRKMYQGIKKALELGAQDDNVTVTVLTGAGNSYSSGNDLSDITPDIENLEEAFRKTLEYVSDFVRAFIDYPKILVAVVNGQAIGIAVTTLGLCDVVYASENATFQTPFTSLGLLAEGCSSYIFPKIMGQSMTGEMLYFNRKLSAKEAKNFGLVSEIFKKNSLNQIFEKLESFADLPPKSLYRSKLIVRGPERDLLHQVNHMEMQNLIKQFETGEPMEAVMKLMMKKSKL